MSIYSPGEKLLLMSQKLQVMCRAIKKLSEKLVNYIYSNEQRTTLPISIKKLQKIKIDMEEYFSSIIKKSYSDAEISFSQDINNGFFFSIDGYENLIFKLQHFVSVSVYIENGVLKELICFDTNQREYFWLNKYGEIYINSTLAFSNNYFQFHILVLHNNVQKNILDTIIKRILCIYDVDDKEYNEENDELQNNIYTNLENTTSQSNEDLKKTENINNKEINQETKTKDLNQKDIDKQKNEPVSNYIHFRVTGTNILNIIYVIIGRAHGFAIKNPSNLEKIIVQRLYKIFGCNSFFDEETNTLYLYRKLEKKFDRF